jgi:hypothetical protein
MWIPAAAPNVIDHKLSGPVAWRGEDLSTDDWRINLDAR